MVKKRKTIRRSTTGPLPSRSARRADWEIASEQCDRIAEIIDELEEEGTVDKAPGFFESVREKVISIQETICRNLHVTERQQTALDNMEHGVNKWVH